VTSGRGQQNKGARVHDRPPSWRDGSSSGLSVTVVFTTVSATLAALRKAAVLAHQLGAHIQIVVPYVVPYPLPLDCPQADPNFRARRLRILCEQEPIETRIDIRRRRDASECLMQELAPRSIVLMGDERR
jgi:hypothetical protein